MTLIIRNVKKEDNEKLAKLIRDVFEEYNVIKAGTVYFDPTTDALSQLFTTPKSVLYVAEEDGQILGCCGIFPTDNLPEGYTELVKFYVAKEGRGKKIGLKLMTKSIEFAKKLKYDYVYLECIPEFKKALSMYQREGFEKIENRLGDSKHYGCDILMLKKINN